MGKLRFHTDKPNYASVDNVVRSLSGEDVPIIVPELKLVPVDYDDSDLIQKIEELDMSLSARIVELEQKPIPASIKIQEFYNLGQLVEENFSKFSQRLAILEKQEAPQPIEIIKEIKEVKEIKIEYKIPKYVPVALILQALAIIALIVLK